MDDKIISIHQSEYGSILMFTLIDMFDHNECSSFTLKSLTFVNKIV